MYAATSIGSICSSCQALDLAPIGKPVGGRQVRQARVRVSDIGSEKFPKPFFRPLLEPENSIGVSWRAIRVGIIAVRSMVINSVSTSAPQ